MQDNDEANPINVLLGQKIENNLNAQTHEHRPLWFVFDDKQPVWPDVTSIMKIPAVNDSIKAMADAVEPNDIDLLKIINLKSNAEDLLVKTLNVVALQVAMIDLLKEIGIRPDGLIGHSVGEIGCGYADGLLTAKQAILCAYWVGRSLQETEAERYKFKENLRNIIPNFKPKPAWWVSATSCNNGGIICNAEYFFDILNLPVETTALEVVPEDSVFVKMGSKQLNNWISTYIPLT